MKHATKENISELETYQINVLQVECHQEIEICRQNKELKLLYQLVSNSKDHKHQDQVLQKWEQYDLKLQNNLVK